MPTTKTKKGENSGGVRVGGVGALMYRICLAQKSPKTVEI